MVCYQFHGFSANFLRIYFLLIVFDKTLKNWFVILFWKYFISNERNYIQKNRVSAAIGKHEFSKCGKSKPYRKLYINHSRIAEKKRVTGGAFLRLGWGKVSRRKIRANLFAYCVPTDVDGRKASFFSYLVLLTY